MCDDTHDNTAACFWRFRAAIRETRAPGMFLGTRGESISTRDRQFLEVGPESSIAPAGGLFSRRNGDFIATPGVAFPRAGQVDSVKNTLDATDRFACAKGAYAQSTIIRVLP